MQDEVGANHDTSLDAHGFEASFDKQGEGISQLQAAVNLSYRNNRIAQLQRNVDASVLNNSTIAPKGYHPSESVVIQRMLERKKDPKHPRVKELIDMWVGALMSADPKAPRHAKFLEMVTDDKDYTENEIQEAISKLSNAELEESEKDEDNENPSEELAWSDDDDGFDWDEYETSSKDEDKAQSKGKEKLVSSSAEITPEDTEEKEPYPK